MRMAIVLLSLAWFALSGCNFVVQDTRSPEERAAVAAEIAAVEADEASDVDCAIKGNISSTGAKIYHLPAGAYYNRVRIDLDKGEAYFCSEDEAVAAGFRKSLR